MSETFASYQVETGNEDPAAYAQNRPMNPASEVGGTIRVSMDGQGGGSTELTRVTSSQALDNDQLQPEGDVLGSLQTRYGSPKSSFGSRVDPTDTLELRPGLRTSVANAAQLGIVRLSPDGSLTLNPALQGTNGPSQSSAAQAASQEASQGSQEKKGYEHTKPLPDDPHLPVKLEDRKMTAAIDTMSRGLDPITLKEINRQIAQGQLTEQGLEQVATTLGTSFQEAAEIVDAAAAGYRTLKDNAMSQAGLATERVQKLFQDWAQRERTADWRQAQADVFAFQSNTQLAKLARDFMSRYDTIDPQQTMGMLEDAGFKNVRKTDGGSVIFDHPDHGTVSWKQAYQQGLFKTPVAKTVEY